MCGAEKLMRAALDEVSGCFDDDTAENVRELLSSGEPGVALEILCSQLVEFDISVSQGVKDLLAESARNMGMDIEELREIRVL
ncbi:MafI family immunity protein [Pseudomonas sp. F(2018)]|uniref:MafI family immunity protein n=1 Tax=Pseudomonas sp. F(2018) TaxID=2502240 RepID=UPI0010F82D94|nr:MafI family immunity protein [Pseudomonas sp. F(2018)]